MNTHLHDFSRFDRDWRLIRLFVDRNDQGAFAELTRLHLKLVYSTCLREVGDVALAEDATQAVFLLLAQKASSFRKGIGLVSWLFQTSRYAARKAIKRERTRALYELRAAQQAQLTDMDAFEDSREFGVALNEALYALPQGDRNALLMRYFDEYTLKEVGVAIGISEDGARLRINRALDKMRRPLSKSGFMIGAVALVTLLEAQGSASPADTLAAKVAGLGTQDGIEVTVSTAVHQITQGVSHMLRMKTVIAITASIMGTVAIVGGIASLQASASDGDIIAQQGPTINNLKQLAFATMKYSRDHDHKLPEAKTWKTDLAPYATSASIFQDTPTASHSYHFVMNSHLSNVRMTSLSPSRAATTPLYFESKAPGSSMAGSKADAEALIGDPAGVIVGTADGVVTVVHTQAELDKLTWTP